METKGVVERALAGDEAAFVVILDRFEQPLFSYFRRRGVPRSQAEDLVQQVFVVLLETRDRYDPGAGSLQGYLFGIAWRVWTRHVQRVARQAVDLPVDIADPTNETPQRRVIDQEEIEQVRAAVGQLPDAVREVLSLRIYEHLPIAEIGRTLGMPVNTVKSHLYRARRMLAGWLGDRETQSEAHHDL